MAAVSALEPAPRTCGGEGSAPSLDAGEPAALPPAAGPTATGTALGSRRPYSRPRAARLALPPELLVPFAPGASALPALPPPLSEVQWSRALVVAEAGPRVFEEPGSPPGGSSLALKLFAGVARGISSGSSLPKTVWSESG